MSHSYNFQKIRSQLTAFPTSYPRSLITTAQSQKVVKGITANEEPMSVLQQVLHLNNEGVSMLASGDEGKAMGLFQDSLRLMKDKFARERAEEDLLDATNNTTSVATAPAKCDSIDRHFEDEPSRIYETVEMEGFRDSSDFFIFNSAIKLSPDALANHSRQQDPDISILFTAYILFNTAIAYHNHGIVHAKQTCLDKAAGIYHQTIKLLRTCAGQCERNATSSMIEMAALNNLSHIHLVQGDHVQSRQLLEDLAGLTSFVGAFDFAPRLFADKDVNQLLVNIFFLIASASAAPAA